MNYTRGNAASDAQRGWFVGQFVPESGGLRKRSDVELKWGIHPRGEERPASWGSYRTATTITILMTGELVIRLKEGEAVEEVYLGTAGDYVIIPPGLAHDWRAITDCTVLTVRTPSVAGDAVRHTD